MEPNNFATSNGSMHPTGPIAAPAPLRPAAAAMNKAELYEDEKRRIMSSCFAKKDERGRLLQSYITHMRVIEDGAYPSSPPPPDANPNYKKARVILVAVKNTGRVFVHKARENDDLTFQIGKSWPLEELQSIESFSSASPQTPEEQERAQWAGNAGFMISMGKPYYWQANSPKEKEFFIGSLVKIYKKYTSGNIPDLIGFSALEREAILVGGQPSSNRSTSGQSSGAVPPTSPSRPEDLRPPQARRPSTSHSDQGVPKFTSRIASPESGSAMQSPQSPTFPPAVQQPSAIATPEVSSHPSRSGTPPRSRPPQESSIRGPRGQSPGMVPTPPYGASPRLRAQSPRTQAPEGRLDRPPDQPPALNDNSNLPPFAPRVNGAPPSGPRSRQGSSRGMSPEPLVTERSRPYTPEFQPPEPAPNSPPERRRPPLEDRGLNSAPRTLRTDSPASSVGGLSTSKSSSQPTDGASTKPAQLTTSREASTSAVPTPPPRHEDHRVVESKAATSPEPAESTSTPTEDEPHFRPGLGPMMAKKPSLDVQSKLRKAATAAGAFKPRAGGALERLRKTTDDGDGMTGVVPAPSSAKRATTEDIFQSPTQLESASRETSTWEQPPNDQSSAELQSNVLDNNRDVDQPTPEPPTPSEMAADGLQRPRIQRPPLKSANRVLQRRRSNLYAKSLATLDIDGRVLEGREAGFESVLAEFGWDQEAMRAKKIDAFETDLRREIGRLEAGGWLGNDDHKEDQVAAVEKMLDKAIAECEEMDGLLTLYGVELGSLNEDIFYVEAQSQGLQVQTANQKLLQTELQRLVDTISMGATQMEPLRRNSLADHKSLEAIESCLVLLYKALLTIDPALVKNPNTLESAAGLGDHNFANMRALQEKKGLYLEEAMRFLERLKNYVDPTFGAAFAKTTEAFKHSSISNKGSLDIGAHDAARDELWQFSPMMLFAKELDVNIWDEIIRAYRGRARPLYEGEFQDNVMVWKKAARKPTGDEQEALFTTYAHESEGLASTARKLTVKRSATLARGLRSSHQDKRSALDKSQDGRLYAYEAFAGTLEEMIPLICAEHNFVAEFFHATSLESTDFVEAVTSTKPWERQGYDLKSPRIMDPDRGMASRVLEAMEDIFSPWAGDMQSLVDWAIKSDSFQGIGILCALERKRLELEDSNQEFVARTLQKLHERLSALFTRFVDDQIRAIEETKVKIKKRRGVIFFVKIFPHFSALVEATLPRADAPENLEIRSTVDAAYEKINKAMWDSLKVIAKESPTAGMNGIAPGFTGAALGHGTDSEDKEALNYHILLIENMYHYYTEVEEHGDPVLGEWRGKAMLEMSEHQEAYVNAVIRRPLGKLLDFVESTENIMNTSARDNPSSIPTSHPSHSRSVFKKVLGSYDAKEVRRGIDTLRKRIEKHFGEADDPAISQKLVTQILGECERHFNDALERTEKIAKDVYEGSVDVEFSKADISQAFRR